MKRVRKEDLSLHHYIKNIVLQDYVETETSTLEYLDDQSSTSSYVYQVESTMTPLPTSLGRGWRYLDNPYDIVNHGIGPDQSVVWAVHDPQYDFKFNPDGTKLFR